MGVGRGKGGRKKKLKRITYGIGLVVHGAGLSARRRARVFLV